MIELKSRYSEKKVLFKSEAATTVKEALVEAVNKKAYLGGADLRGADLRGAYLRGADLRGAYLRDADLGGADLRGADLRDAYLRDADLRDADLRGADLRGAYLGGAYLRDADLVDAGQDIRGYRFVGYWREGLRIVAGCRDYTIEEARAHWAGNAECAAKVALIETVAALRGLGKEAAKTEAA